MTLKSDRRAFLLASGAAAGLSTMKLPPGHASTTRVRVVGLRVDSLETPLGLENPCPRFSWRLESQARNVSQSAYRVRVASSAAALKTGHGDVWDSGQIRSHQSVGIVYQG